MLVQAGRLGNLRITTRSIIYLAELSASNNVTKLDAPAIEPSRTAAAMAVAFSVVTLVASGAFPCNDAAGVLIDVVDRNAAGVVEANSMDRRRNCASRSRASNAGMRAAASLGGVPSAKLNNHAELTPGADALVVSIDSSSLVDAESSEAASSCRSNAHMANRSCVSVALSLKRRRQLANGSMRVRTRPAVSVYRERE